MKAGSLAAFQRDCWRNIAIILIDPHRPISHECDRLFTTAIPFVVGSDWSADANQVPVTPSSAHS